MERPMLANWEFGRPDTNLPDIIAWIYQAPQQPWSLIIPVPYPILDTAIAKYFSVQNQPKPPFKEKARRKEITSHSCRYIVRMYMEEQPGERIDTAGGEICLFTVSADQTDVWVLPGPLPLPKESTDLFFSLIRDCFRRVLVEQNLAALYQQWHAIDTEFAQSEIIEQLSKVQAAPPAPPPKAPDPDVDGWDAVFDWQEEFGKSSGIITDEDLAKAIFKSKKTVRNKRSELGRSKRRKKVGT